MNVTDKRVLVVGLGKSGVAAALFLKAHGARVTVSDSKPAEELRQQIPALLDAGIAVETGGHGERTFREQDLIVVSPGVPSDAAPLMQARALGEPVIGEVELASSFPAGVAGRDHRIEWQDDDHSHWWARSWRREASLPWWAETLARPRYRWWSKRDLTP